MLSIGDDDEMHRQYVHHSTSIVSATIMALVEIGNHEVGDIAKLKLQVHNIASHS